MAQMFARSTLNTWNNTGSSGSGWSNTSGGASNGTSPDSSTDVVFDSNSGTARNIAFTDGLSSGFIPCKSITTATANAMTFNNQAITFQPYGAVTLTGSNATFAIAWGTSGSFNVNPGNSTFLTFDTGTATLTLTNNLAVSGQFTLSTSFSANNFNVTAGNLLVSGSPTITMGSGTWNMTAVSGSPWVMGSSATVTAGTSTVKFTGSGSGSKTFSGQGKTYNNFWNNTSGAGICIIDGSNTFNDFKTDSGRAQRFTISTTQTVTTFTADGTGNVITIDTTSPGTAATLTKAGGGSIYVDYCSIKDITGSPVSTWNARNSTNVGGNTNITFIPGNSSFMQFF